MATKAAQFKSLAQGSELTLPSGFTVVARRVDIRTMLKTGRIPNTLRPILDRAMQGEEAKPEELGNILDDPEKLDEMFGFVDQLWVDCVIDPVSAPDPRPEVKDAQGNVIHEAEPDDPEIVYPKDVQDADKMFIMNWCMGGSKDLERFREESEAHVQRLHYVAGSGSPSLPPPPPGGPV